VRSGLQSTGQDIGLNAGHARALRDALARHVHAARRAKTVPGGQPGRTQDTGEPNGQTTLSLSQVQVVVSAVA
jgi:hypothetical protein